MSDRAQVTVTALQCATTAILAAVLPAWLVAIPLAVLSLAIGVAIVLRPELARQGLEVIQALLTPPRAGSMGRRSRPDSRRDPSDKRPSTKEGPG